MSNPYADFRRLERLIFDGVPEKPEPIFEVNTQADTHGRVSMRSSSPESSNIVASESLSIPLGTYSYYPDLEKIEFEPLG